MYVTTSPLLAIEARSYHDRDFAHANAVRAARRIRVRRTRQRLATTRRHAAHPVSTSH